MGFIFLLILLHVNYFKRKSCFFASFRKRVNKFQTFVCLHVIGCVPDGWTCNPLPKQLANLNNSCEKYIKKNKRKKNIESYFLLSFFSSTSFNV